MEVTKENQSQKKEGEQVDRQDEDLDTEHGHVNVMLGRGAKFQRDAPTDTSPRHLDMGDHVVEYPKHLEDLCSDDKAYTQEDTNADEEAEADSFHKDGDVNECVARPCGHGNCVNYPGGYRCTCLPGWTGQNCQQVVNMQKWAKMYAAMPEDINECTTNPCQHGRCENYAGEYSCTCFTGWTGKNCQQGYYSVKETSMSVSETHVSMEAVLTKMADTIATVTMDGLEQTVSKNTVMPFSTAIPCQGGWSEYNNYCYKLFKDKVSWSTANGRCKQHGANLASVGSAGENNFITHLISDGG
ncbi:hypothetical protein Bbelb_271990 [Branchiostoma belcheri]|nr:hypothetical protein Bbelb_271990 [Branchiostoma belcheri]